MWHVTKSCSVQLSSVHNFFPPFRACQEMLKIMAMISLFKTEGEERKTIMWVSGVFYCFKRKYDMIVHIIIQWLSNILRENSVMTLYYILVSSQLFNSYYLLNHCLVLLFRIHQEAMTAMKEVSYTFTIHCRHFLKQ